MVGTAFQTLQHHPAFLLVGSSPGTKERRHGREHEHRGCPRQRAQPRCSLFRVRLDRLCREGSSDAGSDGHDVWVFAAAAMIFVDGWMDGWIVVLCGVCVDQDTLGGKKITDITRPACPPLQKRRQPLRVYDDDHDGDGDDDVDQQQRGFDQQPTTGARGLPDTA